MFLSIDDPGIPTNASFEIFVTKSAVRDVRATTLLFFEELIDDLSSSDKLMLPLLKIAIKKITIGKIENIRMFFFLT